MECLCVSVAGESILVCKSNERQKAVQLVTSQLPPVKSCLQRSVEEGLSSSMKRALLEVAEEVMNYDFGVAL